MKVGDLVMLKHSKDFPDCKGSLTAVKFYKRLINECQGKTMLILGIYKHRESLTTTVLVDGYKKSINGNFLRVVSEGG